MKVLIYISIVVLIIQGCNSNQEQQINSLSFKDSVLIRESEQKDSTIVSYIKWMNEIGDNLDSIKSTEKILSVNRLGIEFQRQGSITDDIRSINIRLLNYHRQIYYLEKKLKSSDGQNKEIQKMEGHLADELAEKDSEMAVLQVKLEEANNSLKAVMLQFNDSLSVMNGQKITISDMNTESREVYYVIGTIPELKKKGIISKKGVLASLEINVEMKQSLNTAYFTKGDRTLLSIIPIDDRFYKILTNHPSNSYRVTNNYKYLSNKPTTDSLFIKDPVSFWSVSKYLVIVVRE